MSERKLKIAGVSIARSSEWQALRKLAEKCSWPWDFVEFDELDLSDLEGFNAALVPLSSGKGSIEKFQVLPTQVRKLEVLDSLFLESGTLLPRLIIPEALRQFLVYSVKDIDIREPAFIVGDTPIVRVAGSVLADMGYGTIYLVGDSDALQTEKAILKRAQFGVQYQIVNPENLTLQAVSASLLINTASLPEGDLFLNDLSYFNYMKPEGVVLDLNPVDEEKPLLKEAVDANLRTLDTEVYIDFYIYHWLHKLEDSSFHLQFEEVQKLLR